MAADTSGDYRYPGGGWVAILDNRGSAGEARLAARKTKWMRGKTNRGRKALLCIGFHDCGASAPRGRRVT
jgi:hypothetical protein